MCLTDCNYQHTSLGSSHHVSNARTSNRSLHQARLKVSVGWPDSHTPGCCVQSSSTTTAWPSGSRATHTNQHHQRRAKTVVTETGSTVSELCVPVQRSPSRCPNSSLLPVLCVRGCGPSIVFNRDIISMPDKWEYPWYASWDLAFHMIPFAVIDPEFAKSQVSQYLARCSRFASCVYSWWCRQVVAMHEQTNIFRTHCSATVHCLCSRV
jgi:hypothetical protein